MALVSCAGKARRRTDSTSPGEGLLGRSPAGAERRPHGGCAPRPPPSHSAVGRKGRENSVVGERKDDGQAVLEYFLQSETQNSFPKSPVHPIAVSRPSPLPAALAALLGSRALEREPATGPTPGLTRGASGGEKTRFSQTLCAAAGLVQSGRPPLGNSPQPTMLPGKTTGKLSTEASVCCEP